MVQIHSDSFVSSWEKTSKFELASGKIYKFIWRGHISAGANTSCRINLVTGGDSYWGDIFYKVYNGSVNETVYRIIDVPAPSTIYSLKVTTTLTGNIGLYGSDIFAIPMN